MNITTLMAGKTLNPTFTGFVTNDDWVLALDCGATAAADFSDAGSFEVVQMGVAGLDSNLNPITQDKTYLRAGQSTTKTGNQRSFAVTGDRYIGDDFQDFALGHTIKYGTGQTVIRKYVYFNIVTGAGEKGEVSIIVNSDGSGEAGNTSAIDVELRKAGNAPEEYTWTNYTEEKFSGDGSTTQFTLTVGTAPDAIALVKVGGETVTAYTYAKATKKVTFTTAPTSGTNNISVFY